ncbi:response regulator transcription factor [Pseudomonas sp. 2(2015)]|uniref:response regulator transcription factor n=1 Tax=Pseudomonas sp. 2(2015) TaxID=1619950 RepID=UPI0005EB98BF|nr:response regulator transcription factor [Pseudomonas sp. 2(2015)]KJK14902.1 LuxR family transcriptional regulator [Pseudomonas sp. 2(2015)]
MHSVLIVDDHPVIRLAVRVLLEKHGMRVVGEADNGVDAVQLVRDLTPQVVILDIGIPKLDGFTVISRIKALKVRSEILILTSQPADSVCRRCIQLGARGFVNKEEDLGSLITAIKAVDAGYSFFPTLTFDSVNTAEQLSELELIRSLTDREVTVLQYLAQGYSNKQIGDMLFLSNKTVSTYKTRLLQKLGAASLVDLAEFAKRNALTGT